MTDEHIPNGTTVKLGRVEGGLRAGNNAKIQAEDGTLVLVTGGAEFGGNAVVECDLECQSLTVERSGKLRVTGNLTVHGPLDVSNSVEVEGTISSDTVDVGGHIKAGSISCKKMRVGGTAEISKSLTAESVDVGGKIEVRGALDVKDLQVGGKAEVGGGVIRGTINAGGRFESSGKLDFGELQVFGLGSLKGDSKGKKLVASGKFEALGDLQCDEVDVYGIGSISGSCKAVRVDVKGKLEISGSLDASEGVEVNGMTNVKDNFSAESIKIRGRFSVKRATVAKDAQINGSVETREGLKASTIVIDSGTRCEGPLIAEKVDVGQSGPGFSGFAWGQRIRIQAGTTQVEDVYADTITLGPGSRAKRLSAKSVKLGSGCDVEEVTYVDDLKMADHVKISRPVRKVDRLPDAPF